jgi:outer membrane cobalamin receptor
MKNMKNWFLVSLFFLSISVFAQGKITGTVQDESGPLPGANVVIEGTKQATSTAFDGSFILTSTSSTGNIVISYMGYDTQKVSFSISNGTANLGAITLKSEGNVLGEVVVTSTVVDIAKDRKTPVAVSTIKAAEIREKLGSQEFPEILATTPSVYVTKQGGGFGDARINVRGFDQRNVAVMINGVPVNDMENGSVFWSNWAGLSDVTTAMQVQRGLGSSKLAISSVGGTINVLTRTADAKQGGLISTTVGNGDYLKTLASYSTGKMKNGLSASILLSNTMGNGYVDGTKFLGQNYFIGLGYEFNDKHDIQFTFTGAPQWHDQRSNQIVISDYLKYSKDGEPNIRYNSDWGYLNGEKYSFRTNFYHKPIASLNYNFKINNNTKISTVFYGSWGRGGGSNGAGAIRGNRFNALNLRTPEGLIDVDLIQAWNSGESVGIIPSTGPQVPNFTPRAQIGGAYQNSSSTSNNGTNGISKISSVNSHDWYGGIINLNHKLNNNLTLDFGLDARTYRGYHYQVLNDIIGATNYSDNFDVNNVNGSGVQVPRILTTTYNTKPNYNPFADLSGQEKINYNNDGLVRWYGAFTQLEYSKDNLTAFIQGAVSQQGFKRVDYFKYKSNDALSSTDFENILGGNIKGGANYNINDNMNVFVNAGYYSKQPFFNAVYPNNASVVNENLTNEKILGIEAGYGYRSSKFNANLNLYRTSWKDRFTRISTNIDHDQNGTTPAIPGNAFLQGVEQIHMGAELDFTYKPFQKLSVNGMVSYGDWKYGKNVTANYQDDNNVVITNPATGDAFTETLYIDNVRVGDIAQTTASLGASYEIVEGLKVDSNYRIADRLYSAIDPVNFRTESARKLGALELPSYGLLDAGLSFKTYRVKGSKDYFNFRLNVNNILDEIYISESRTNQFSATQTEFDNGTGNGLINPAGNTTAANNKLKGTGAGQYPTYQDYLSKGIYNNVDVRNQAFFGLGRTWNFTFSYNF